MARGEKHSDEVRERAICLLMMGESVAAVAKKLKLSDSTVRSWKKALEGGELADEFAKIRALKKERFIANAWEIVERSQRMIQRRLERAEERETEIVQAMEFVLTNANLLSKEELKGALANLSALRVEDMGRLSSVMGIAYDKQALANGDPTANVNGTSTVKFEDM